MYADMLEDVNSEQPEATSRRSFCGGRSSRSRWPSSPTACATCSSFASASTGATPKTLEEVGAELGVTRERVRQLESRALRELQAAAPDLRLYLRAE